MAKRKIKGDYVNPHGFDIPTVPIAADAYVNVKPWRPVNTQTNDQTKES